ncbi:hypothetical protein WJT74_05280 [Sphingomicrobium sp. XHP0239]|uniref:tetratricopeptide repeat protein n=1 Tax=Sphingomicrobium maritimum TaxID=3133972 RepID=UPI0031CC518D
MTVYLIIILLIGVVAAGLWLAKVRGATLTLSLAAMLLGGAGYAIAGRPGLPARPVAERPDMGPPMALTGAREAFYGRFNQVEQWAILADSRTRIGNTESAAKLYASGVRENPRNFALWSLYANALADHAGTLSPAAELAFDRAIELGGDAEGPLFFKALAQVRSGEGEAALPALRSLEERAPEGSDRRALVLGALAIAEQQAAAQTGS